ncbi:uncharacterized protein LOC135226715 [Macrobrachium nipponense]|uniref:uncharacterized protein LOC135226715 n=1 Tax=Macrobrachium nipponense TaxID=159736 RepID=UPI0030C7D664
MCAEALLSSWIIHFRAPDHIMMDCRATFLSDLWAALALLMGTSHHRTTTYNPTASLMARYSGDNWEMQLPWVLLSLRTAPRANDETSPAEKVYGETLTFSDRSFLAQGLSHKQKRLCLRHNTHRPPPCHGPFCILHHSEKAYLLHISGCEDWVSIGRMKPAFLTEEDTAEDEPGNWPKVPPQNLFSPEPPNYTKGTATLLR